MTISFSLVSRFLLLLLAGNLFAGPSSIAAEQKRNVLIITVDDMSADSLGAFGCKLPDTSPNIDALARQGMRFNRAHVVVGNCFPSRNVMWSGLYPHNTGVEGFYQVRDAKHLHLADLMKRAGYYTGILHKVSHSTPYSPYPSWDVDLTSDPEGRKRDVKAAGDLRRRCGTGHSGGARGGQAVLPGDERGRSAQAVLRRRKNRGQTIPDVERPVPRVHARGSAGPRFPVRRSGRPQGAVALLLQRAAGGRLRGRDSRRARRLRCNATTRSSCFLSDHGMPLPFAKTQVYHHSSRTPLFLIVPGVTKAGTVDDDHMVSAVDLLPTLLELTGIEHPGPNGWAFLRAAAAW